VHKNRTVFEIKNVPVQKTAQGRSLYGVSKEVSNHNAALFGIECQLRSEVGVGDGDKLACAGAERFTLKMGNAVFGDDIVHIIFAGGDDCTGLKNGLYSAYGSVLGGGGEGNEALAALGKGSAADIVDLAAGTGHMLGADALSAYLTPDVALKSCVYGDHISVLANNGRVIDIVNRQEGDTGIVVYIVIELSGTVGKGGDRLAAVDLLFAVVYCAALQKFHHGVGEHLGVDAQVVLAFQRCTDSIGDGAYAQLNAGAVINKLCNKAADGFTDVVHLCGLEFGQGTADLNEPVNLAYMDLRAADGAGDLVIYLKENAVGFFHHCTAVRTDGAKREVAVLVHGRDGSTVSVILILSADVSGDITVVIGDNVCHAVIDLLAGAAAGEPGFAYKSVVKSRIKQVRGGLYVQQGLYTDAVKFSVGSSLSESFKNSGGVGYGSVHAYAPSVFHDGGDFSGGAFFLFIKSFIVHDICILFVILW